jgi:hypothetical protein
VLLLVSVVVVEVIRVLLSVVVEGVLLQLSEVEGLQSEVVVRVLLLLLEEVVALPVVEKEVLLLLLEAAEVTSQLEMVVVMVDSVEEDSAMEVDSVEEDSAMEVVDSAMEATPRDSFVRSSKIEQTL